MEGGCQGESSQMDVFTVLVTASIAMPPCQYSIKIYSLVIQVSIRSKCSEYLKLSITRLLNDYISKSAAAAATSGGAILQIQQSGTLRRCVSIGLLDMAGASVGDICTLSVAFQCIQRTCRVAVASQYNLTTRKLESLFFCNLSHRPHFLYIIIRFNIFSTFTNMFNVKHCVALCCPCKYSLCALLKYFTKLLDVDTGISTNSDMELNVKCMFCCRNHTGTGAI